MNAYEAADFLRLSYDAFRKVAPSMPRYKVAGGYRYLQSELLAWLRETAEYSHEAQRRQRDGNAGAPQRTDRHTSKREGKVVRLI